MLLKSVFVLFDSSALIQLPELEEEVEPEPATSTDPVGAPRQRISEMMKNAIESDDFSQLAAVIQKGLAKGIRREKLYYSDLGLGLIGAGEDEHILLAAASAGATRVAMYLIGSHGLKFNGGLCTALLPPACLTLTADSVAPSSRVHAGWFWFLLLGWRAVDRRHRPLRHAPRLPIDSRL